MAWYRARFIESPVCDAAAPPFACLPRAAVFWLQYQYGFGLAALVIGLAAFLTRSYWLGVAGMAVGGVAVLYYNATWGMIGAALGAWAWLGRSRPA